MTAFSAHPEPSISTEFRSGLDRRRGDRRRQPRARADRRWDDRRAAIGRAGLSAALVALLTQGRMPAAGVGMPPPDIALSSPQKPVPSLAPSPSSPYDRFIQEAAALYGISADLVRAVIQTESNFNPRAKSRAGARGLMQLTPLTLRELRLKIDPFDPRQNILAGAKYLSMLLDRFEGDVPLALASYNAGPSAVRRHRGIPPYKETRGYVRKIQNLLDVAATEVTAAD